MKEFKYLRAFVHEGGEDGEEELSAASAVKWALYWTIMVKRELRQQSKAVDIPLNLRSNSHLWP